MFVLRHWLQLALTDGIGPILSRRLIEATGSAEAACNATARELSSADGIGTTKAGKIATALRESAVQVDAELERCRASGVTILCPDDSTYPLLLRTIPDPPNVLYVRGELEPRDLHAVAIVGSRRCSFYGREQAERFAALLAGAGVTVISGGARGVDSAAHRGAISHLHGRTIAVLGSGVDTPYPPENAGLFDQIAKRGAVISEFPLGTPPVKENFPRRNRIVSGMSRGVLVVEADERSGALITARQACDDHGRPVFAIPGRVDNPLSAGPHQLIRDGAILVSKLEEILEGLGPLPEGADVPLETTESPGNEEALIAAPKPAAISAHGITDQQHAILQGMGVDPIPVDLIVDRTGLSAQIILQELTFLSLKGRVRRVEGQTYARRN
ncbi:MAG TPA: DNA-processing protein DprA [Humisphaera sp.]|jgi:DNA processing protein|nr:DNA-processing protein DprA [Humisphaera sp.]